MRTPKLKQGESASAILRFKGQEGKVTFDMSVHSMMPNHLDFLVNDVTYKRIVGKNQLNQITLPLPAEENVKLEWRYTKAHAEAHDFDYAQIDNLLIDADLDTDKDSLNDAWEYKYFGHLNQNQHHDDDVDELTNLQEQDLKTNPINHDTDGDQLFDGWEHEYGNNPREAKDGEGLYHALNQEAYLSMKRR